MAATSNGLQRSHLLIRVEQVEIGSPGLGQGSDFPEKSDVILIFGFQSTDQLIGMPRCRPVNGRKMSCFTREKKRSAAMTHSG
jgi:hypothetical protein